jgi:hypothetical protein
MNHCPASIEKYNAQDVSSPFLSDDVPIRKTQKNLTKFHFFFSLFLNSRCGRRKLQSYIVYIYIFPYKYNIIKEKKKCQMEAWDFLVLSTGYDLPNLTSKSKKKGINFENSFFFFFIQEKKIKFELYKNHFHWCVTWTSSSSAWIIPSMSFGV